jgi:arylsulfatase A-like enzyme
VPCIIRWPGRVPGGRTDGGLFATIDLFPTFSAIAGAELPDDREIDGVNQLDFICGKSETKRDSYVYNPGYASVQRDIVLGNAIRTKEWKLISPLKIGSFLDDAGSGDWELYNLKDDVGENNNLAAKYPEKVQYLKKLLEAKSPV